MLIQAKHTQCVHIFSVAENAHKILYFSQNKNMKNLVGRSARFLKICIFSAVFAAFFAISIALLPTSTAYAKGESPLYQKLNDEVVRLYEEEIAGEPVVTRLDDMAISNLAEANGFSVKKAQALLMLQDLSTRVGETRTFKDLSALSDYKIFKFGKHCVDSYSKTLSKDKKDELKRKFLEAIK